jgi:glycosyltransferase involved in cell wall biosynthesis
MPPKLTIVVTCYNYACYVPNCLDSVRAQTFGDYELIFVDDGSTDDSEGAVRPYLGDPRFHYLRRPNGGQAKAKNTGIAQATGELVAFLDADDAWDPRKLEKQLTLFADPAVGVVYSRARYIDEHGAAIDFRLEGKYLRPQRGRVTERFFLDNFVPFSSSVVRRACLEEHGVFDESLRMGIDWDLWLRLSVEHAFDYVDEPLLLYRMGHSGQMSKNLEVRQECSDRIMTRFVERNPGLLPRRVIRRAWAYTYVNRALYFAETDPEKSRAHLRRAIRSSPTFLPAYRSILSRGLRRVAELWRRSSRRDSE